MITIEPYAESLRGGPVEVGLIMKCTLCGWTARAGRLRGRVALTVIIDGAMAHLDTEQGIDELRGDDDDGDGLRPAAIR